MSLEIAILELLADDIWPLDQVLARLVESPDGWLVVQHHWEAGNLEILDPQRREALPAWRVRELLRARDAGANVLVTATERGARLVG